MDFIWAKNCGFFLNDIGGENASSIINCANACKDKLACTHFVLSKNWCSFKSGYVSKTDTIELLNSDCGIVSNQYNPSN